MAIRSDILRGHIDAIILQILSEGDSYGYEISKAIEKKTDHQLQVKEGTLYAVFQRLEKKNYIASYQGERTHGGKRKYYMLTVTGRTYLAELVEEWQEIKKLMNIFLEGQ